jgi:hypothetical protein
MLGVAAEAKAGVHLVRIQEPSEQGEPGLSRSVPALDARGWNPQRVIDEAGATEWSGSTVPGVRGVVLIDRQPTDVLALKLGFQELLALELPPKAALLEAISAHFRSMPAEGLTYRPALSVATGGAPNESHGGSPNGDHGEAYARDPDYANPALLRAWWERLGAPWRPEDARDSET